MKRFFWVVIFLICSLNGAIGDNSRFYGTFQGSAIGCGGEVFGTPMIGNDPSLDTNGPTSEGYLYFYLPLEGNQFSLSYVNEYGDPEQTTITISGANYEDETSSSCSGPINGGATRVMTRPAAPVPSFPADESTGVSLVSALEIGPFSDPDIGDFHLKTDWQISLTGDFSSPLLTRQSDVLLTSFSVPAGLLQGNTLYYWRARVYDNREMESDWSAPFSFTTIEGFTDTNNNGIPDDLENETVDLNDDGTPDHQQPEIIKSLNTVVGNGQMGISVKETESTAELLTINSIDPATISEYARPHTMPLGMLSYQVRVENPGDTATVKVYFSEAAPENASWFFYDSINGWTDYSRYVTFSANRKSADLKLTDGGHGDTDGIANGIITDPSGFGIASWLKGKISAAATSRGVSQASLSIPDINLNLNALAGGQYLTMLLPGTYDMNVSAAGYKSRAVKGIEVQEADIITQNITLTERVKITGLTISENREVGSRVSFRVTTESKASIIYYRFSVHPGYGTAIYDGTQWKSMTSTEWITKDTIDYKFSANGKYIVVVWVTADPENEDLGQIATLGTSVEIGGSCKTEFKGFSMNGSQTKDSLIRITADSFNSCTSDQYYRFSVHPGYGTAAYDGTQWKSMTSNEWWSSPGMDYAFTEKGKYIVVVWAANSVYNSNSVGMPIIGWSVDIE